MGLADFTDNVETSWGRGCIISYTLHPHIMAGLSSSPIWVPQLWKVPILIYYAEQLLYFSKVLAEPMGAHLYTK